MIQSQEAFETWRNNTSVFNDINNWRESVQNLYKNNVQIQNCLSSYQYELCRYMAGEQLGERAQRDIMPRGVLVAWQPGSGKSLGFIAAGLYVLARRKKEYVNGVIVLVMNKSLQGNAIAEIEKYIYTLNANGLGVDLQPNSHPIKIERVLDLFKFITYNDTRNLEQNVAHQFAALKGFENRFVVVDEAHNLFRSKSGGLDQPVEGTRGQVLYNLFMHYDSLQVVFATGTPIANECRELAPCFQMLTKNPNILDEQYFDQIFVGSNDQHINRDILARRIYGLVHIVQGDDQGDKPELLPLSVIQVSMSDSIVGRYEVQRKKEGIRDSFMQGSRQISTAITNSQGLIISDKFAAILKRIRERPNQAHMVYSNFVDNGCVLFKDYCLQNSTDEAQWEEVVVAQTGIVTVDANDIQKSIQPRLPHQFRVALVHGSIQPEIRTKIIKLFNSENNREQQLINVIVLSPASMEGINLIGVRNLHIVEPQWSWASTEQVIYRAVRRGSHAHLAPADRQVQPHLYISYNNHEVDPNPRGRLQESLTSAGYSTDQIIYYKSKLKYTRNQQFIVTLAMAAINCSDYKNVLSDQLYAQFLFEVDRSQICYSCDPTDQQLFASDNIYKDFAFNNCKRGPSTLQKPADVINIASIAYGYIFDPYARFGVRFFEARDTNRAFIPEDSDVFQQLLGQLKSRIMPIQPQQEQAAHVAMIDDFNVRILRQRELQDPVKSNAEYITELLGPNSHQLRLSYIFGMDSSIAVQVNNKTRLDFSSVFIAPTALLLLCHFTNSIATTELQIVKTLVNIYDRTQSSAHTLTTQTLMNVIQKMKSHSLNSFAEITNDQKLVERQTFVFNQQQLIFRRAIDFVVDVLVNQVQSSNKYEALITALAAITEEKQIVLPITQSLSFIDLIIIKYAIIRISRSDEFIGAISSNNTHVKSQIKESMSNKEEAKPALPVAIVASIIRKQYKPETLYWTPLTLSADRRKIQLNLHNCNVIFSEPPSQTHAHVLRLNNKQRFILTDLQGNQHECKLDDHAGA